MALGLAPKQIIEKNKYPLLNICNDWERVFLGNIIEIQNGYAFSSIYFTREEGVPLIRIRDIADEQTENYFNGEYSDDFVVQKGDFLIGMDGDFKLSKWPGERGLLNQRVCRLRNESKLYNKQFLFFVLQPYLNAIHSETSSVTVKHLSSRTIADIPIPLPPLPEQRAIVKKLESLFSSLDAGVTDLKKAQQQLKIYRQAVLKKAFEGEWKRELLGDVSVVKRGKSKHRPRNDQRLFGGNYPFIQTGEIRKANGGIVKEYENAYSEFGLAQSKLWPKGTLCLTIAANIGETAFLGFDACFPDSVVGITSDIKVLNLYYLNYYIQLTKQEIDRVASATAQKNINVDFLENLEIPVPNPDEQYKIVKQIESRLSVCDSIEQNIKESLEKAEALRQSILKKAFEGSLLTAKELEECKKAADYEPASVLLERIKAEQKQAIKQKK
ncbi:restriction endonuclease subunit S [Pedobacter boryungensis]|uniref:Restriction endonuclease subunit S n=1 Tax=Pedobacter boryungensis TaxID=869962 RepID=A0ABX2DAG6_9SPHI|nr:restriction endonuclease subunit S [Pedobacter boryungensis]NQX30579.1 restriction endonuclease subunit S [Pedobacter boryungensis]